MKKIQIVAVLVVVALVLTAGMAFAGSIANTKHNLRSAGGNTNVIKGTLDEICIYCHTPHGGSQAIAPLWNRSTATPVGFTLYQTSLTMTQTAAITGTSIACLSCHDGVTSINSLVNVNGAAYNGGGVSTVVTGISNLGTDLSNDHPIGVSTSLSGDPDIQNPGGVLARVFGANNLVECGSCHNAHEQVNPMFLRSNNIGSAMCLDCHTK